MSRTKFGPKAVPKVGYKQSESHKNKLSEKARLRGNNGWLGRRHRLDTKEKMRKPKSAAHKQKISTSIKKWWDRDKPQWEVKQPKPEPIPPIKPYVDIFMEDVNIDADGTIWYEVT
jgi:hypothetical protein